MRVRRTEVVVRERVLVGVVHDCAAPDTTAESLAEEVAPVANAGSAAIGLGAKIPLHAVVEARALCAAALLGPEAIEYPPPVDGAIDVGAVAYRWRPLGRRRAHRGSKRNHRKLHFQTVPERRRELCRREERGRSEGVREVVGCGACGIVRGAREKAGKREPQRGRG